MVVGIAVAELGCLPVWKEGGRGRSGRSPSGAKHDEDVRRCCGGPAKDAPGNLTESVHASKCDTEPWRSGANINLCDTGHWTLL